MELEQFLYIPWNIKLKYISLKTCIESGQYDQIIETITRKRLVKSVFENIKINHLAPHVATILRLALQRDQHLNPFITEQLKIAFNSELNLTQVNIFKYIINDLTKYSQDVIVQILNLYGNLPKEKVPVYVLIKLLTYMDSKKLASKIATEKLENFYEIFLIGYSHENDDVRLAAFALLVRREVVLENVRLIERFLVENASIENTSFRNEVVKLYAVYLGKVEDTIFKQMKNTSDQWSNVNVVNHYTWLAEFILNSLKTNSYQRNKLALMLYDLVLRYYEDVVITPEMRKKGLIRKNFETKKIAQVKSFLISNEKWIFNQGDLQQCLLAKLLDESSDISQSAANILITYFKKSSDIDYTKLYVEVRTRLLRVSAFYEIESTVLMLEVTMRNSDKYNLRVKSILDCYISMVRNSFKHLQDSFRAAMISDNGLYYHLLALLRLREYLSKEQLDEILVFLEHLTEIFLNIFRINDVSVEAVPSFADMAQAVRKLLDTDEIDEVLLTDNEQILLNRIWLNLKVCSELISMLGTHSFGGHCQKSCLRLLVSILQGNRHKGVIESAGYSIVHLVQHMTREEVSAELITQTMQDILSSIATESMRSSCTRRTAGLSILIYRIILGDQRKDAPLLKMTIDTCLNVIKADSDLNSSLKTGPTDIRDRCVVIALHCLRPLVHDSSLWPKTEPYLMPIIEVCFQNMSSDKQWSVRNAALQLYGALIPKLTGQNHDAAIEDMHKKYPRLLKYISSLMQEGNDEYLFQIFQLLSQSFVVTHRNQSGDEFWDVVDNIKERIFECLGNKNGYLRILAAKSYAAFTSLKQIELTIFDMIKQVNVALTGVIRMNILQGQILTIVFLYERVKKFSLNVFQPNLDKIELEIENLANRYCLPDFIIRPLLAQLNIYPKVDVDKNVTYKLRRSDNENYFLKSLFVKKGVISADIIEKLPKLLLLYKQHDVLILKKLPKIIKTLLIYYSNIDNEHLRHVIENSFLITVIIDSNIDSLKIKVAIRHDEFYIENTKVTSLFMKCFLLKYCSFSNDLLQTILLELYENCAPKKLEQLRIDVANSLIVLLKLFPNYENMLLFDMMCVCYHLLLDEELAVRQRASIFVAKLREYQNTVQIVHQHSYASSVVLIRECSRLLSPVIRVKFCIYCLLVSKLPEDEKNMRLNPFAHKPALNKNEDFYILNALYEPIKTTQITYKEFCEVQNYFLLNDVFDVCKEDGRFIVNQVKLEFIIKIRSLFRGDKS